ncbi:MAG: type VI secretion system baseplate subunit TssE [Verrucomicrobia bacterium]|nr:type VI secretion system baseplate subunit TssE [Verrucomicrobiota bacterium]
MPELSAVDRLQPCLLDRLFDDDPRHSSSIVQGKAISLQRYKEGIKRDIEWLLNSRSRLDNADALGWDEVRKSVLNFGIRDFTGLNSENLSVIEMERAIQRALEVFEPRFIPGTLEVRHLPLPKNERNRESQAINALHFEISARIWAEPMPQDFVIRTDVALEDGLVTIE